MLKSWETTLSGLVVAGSVVAMHSFPEHSKLITSVMGVFMSYGLIRARDNNVSSEDAGAGKE